MAAISKHEVAVAFSTAEDEEYAAWEARINAACRNGLDYSGRVIIGINVKLSGKVLKRIVSEYQKVGWKVRWVGDQRDGDYLELS